MLRAVLLAVALVSLSAPVSAASAERVVAGLNVPLFVTAPAGDARLFIVERAGRIRIFENGALRSTPFLDISDRVSTQGEGGLLGLAFAPDYGSTRGFYVYYTAPGSPLTSRISRFRASSADPEVADAAEKVLLSLAQPYDNHNGGTVAFGPDGMLFMGFGDGGGGGDPQDRAQKKDTLFGKMIRIDVSFSSFTDDYRVPPDNPFAGNGAYLPEIWALGLRNPYRFSFDRQTGDLYIGDVGQNEREEVDVESASDPGGRNYGWDVMEGTSCYSDPDGGPDPGEPPCNDASLTRPVYEYDHGVGCSITGGYVYRGSQASLRGQYFFADYCSSRIYSFAWNGGGGTSGGVVDRTAELTPPSGQGSIGNPVGFGEDGHGELYVVDPGGEIFRIVPTASPSCGNGRLDPGEQCDDGNTTSGDGCDANCTATACGNGIVTAGEQCDDGNQVSGDGCDAGCIVSACGNGIKAGGEQCDDGNQVSGDGCDANCKITACGNGIVTAGEECDDGNQVSGDGCDANCKVTACGNGIVTAGEDCDDGNTVSGDGCDADCHAAGCGDGVLTPPELCDDGNRVSGDGCDSNCRPTSCGNGIVAGDEECDDGNTASGDGCDENCRLTGCGNGIVTDGEACDDGNGEDSDGCSSTCQVEDPPQSRGQTRCILEVNDGVARVARAQSRNQEECLSAAAKGKLGSVPSAFDACLEADLRGRVADAAERLAKAEGEACSDEPPALALGDDRLSGLPAARELPTALVRDVFGAPARAQDARQAARCQREVLKGSNGLFDAIWSEIRQAQARKLEGRRTPPATSDEELSGFLAAALESSPKIESAGRKLLQRALSRCGGVEISDLFPGCSSPTALSLAACSLQTTRCRACQLLLEANARLQMDCDAFDDGRDDASCAPGP